MLWKLVVMGTIEELNSILSLFPPTPRTLQKVVTYSLKVRLILSRVFQDPRVGNDGVRLVVKLGLLSALHLVVCESFPVGCHEPFPPPESELKCW